MTDAYQEKSGDQQFFTEKPTFYSGADFASSGSGDVYFIEWNGSDAVHTLTAGDFVFSGGNVGIGTSSPSDELEVSGTGHTKVKINSGNGFDAGFDLYENDVGKWYFDNDGDGGDKFRIRSSDTVERFIIQQTGDVKLPNDSQKLYFGTDDDWSINFDGSDLNIVDENGQQGLWINSSSGGPRLFVNNSSVGGEFFRMSAGTIGGGLAISDTGLLLLGTVPVGDPNASLTTYLQMENDGTFRLVNDSQKLTFGVGDDYSIEFDGTDVVHTTSSGLFKFVDGSISIYDVANPQDYIYFNNGSNYFGYEKGGASFYINDTIYFNAAQKGLCWSSSGAQIAENVTADGLDITGNLYLQDDSQKLYFGADDDVSVYFDGSDMIINSENVTSSDELHINNFNALDIGSSNLTTTGTVTSKALMLTPTVSGDVLDISGTNLDLDWNLGHSTDGYGYYWRYEGTGSGDANYLYLYSENGAGADWYFWRAHQTTRVVDYNAQLNIGSLNASDKITFRDSAIYINSIDDGHLDLTADTSIDLNSTVRLPADSQKLYFGVDDDYSIEFDGSDAVHTITAGDFVFSGGNVGIGTSSPSELLEVENNQSDWTRIDCKNNDPGGGIQIRAVAENCLAGFSAYGSSASVAATNVNDNAGLLSSTNLLLIPDSSTATGGTNEIWFYAGGYENSNLRAKFGTSAFKLQGDNYQLYFGADDDVAISFDTTNLLISGANVDLDGFTITGFTASRALQTNGSGEFEVSSVTTTELGYLSGVTSAVQTQLNAREETANKGAANGYCPLDSSSQVPIAYIPGGGTLSGGTF